MSTLVGTVTDEHTKQPVANAMVSAISPALPGGKTVFTGAQGGYSIGDVPAGVYTLRVQASGYFPYDKTGIHLRENATERDVVMLIAESTAAAASS